MSAVRVAKNGDNLALTRTQNSHIRMRLPQRGSLGASAVLPAVSRRRGSFGAMTEVVGSCQPLTATERMSNTPRVAKATHPSQEGIRMKRLLSVAVVVAIGLLTASCGSSRAVLTLSDLDPKLEFLEEVGIVVELIDYPKTGIDSYNEFFRSSALIYFTMDVSRAMVVNATANLKRYAMDHMAKIAMDENLRELVGDTPAEELSTEQSIAVMRMEKERKRISRNERKYYVTMAGQLAIGTLALGRGIKETPDLVKEGKALLRNVRADFTYMGIPKFWEFPGVIKGLDESIDRLNEVRKDAPALVEDITVLWRGFQALST